MFTLGGASLYVYARLRLAIWLRSAAPRHMVTLGGASLHGCAGRCLATWLRSAVPRYMVALGGASLYGCARQCLATWLRSAVPRYMFTLGCASLYVQIFYSWSKDKVNQNIGDVVDPFNKVESLKNMNIALSAAKRTI